MVLLEMRVRTRGKVMNYSVSVCSDGADKVQKIFKSIFVPFLFSLSLGRVPSFGRNLKCVFTPDS